MRVAIVGSRKFQNREKVIELVNSLPQETVIVSGGCHGPDKWAEDAARKRGMDVDIYLPDLPKKNAPWYDFTKAYYARNMKIAQNSDAMHAFVTPDRTGGTENAIKYAKQLNKNVTVHDGE